MRRPNERLIAAPPISTGHVEAARVELVQAQRHLLRRRHQQRREADGVGADLDGLVDDHLDRHLPPEVERRVAVVGEDRVDEALADVVHVAEDGRQHDLALRLALLLVEVALQLRHGPLHHLGRLQHERQDQLAAAEPVADVLHGRQQHLVEQVDGLVVLARAARVEGLVDVVLDALLDAVQDLLVDALVDARARRTRSSRSSSLGLRQLVEVLDQPRQRVRPAVEDQVVGELALLGRDLHVGHGVRRVDHRHVEPGLHAVVQEDRVEHGAGARREAEGDVRDAERRQHAGQLALDQPDALDRLDGRVDPLRRRRWPA